MSIFNQFLSVIEWDEARDDVIFWKWGQKEIKKNSRLVVRPGQDAIFINNGKIEGVFKDEGNYEVETEIIPVLSTLKGFKFGFNSGMRAEVLFVNTKEFTEHWGTKSPVLIPSPALPGGLPIRAFGTFNFRISDYMTLIERIAGIKDSYAVEDVKERISSVLNQYLMKWISKEGKDMFNLQASSFEIGEGIRRDLDADLQQIGLSVTGFSVSNFSYPEEVQDKINKVASVSMVGDLDRYQRVAMADAIGAGGDSSAGGAMQSAIGLAAGMNMAKEMFSGQPAAPAAPVADMVVCASCGKNVPASSKFCPECGAKREQSTGGFCPECGAKAEPGAKFCGECGTKIR